MAWLESYSVNPKDDCIPLFFLYLDPLPTKPWGWHAQRWEKRRFLLNVEILVLMVAVGDGVFVIAGATSGSKFEMVPT